MRLEGLLSEIHDTVRVLAVSLLGGIACGVVVFITWALIGLLIWANFWLVLRKVGIYIHDIGGAYLIAFGPPFVGIMFVVMTALSLLALRWINSRKTAGVATYVLNIIPALAVFGFVNAHLFTTTAHYRPWRYRLTELSVLATGLLWRRILLKLNSWVQPALKPLGM